MPHIVAHCRTYADGKRCSVVVTVCRADAGVPQAKYLAACTKKSEEEVTADFQRPRYFTPYEAVQYGLIDTVRQRAGSWDAIGAEHVQMAV